MGAGFINYYSGRITFARSGERISVLAVLMSTSTKSASNLEGVPEIEVGERRWSRFLRIWLIGILIIGLAVAALNIVVDPFYLFDMPRIGNFNKFKPATQGREILAKSALLKRAEPRTLLVGASKVQVGLDPNSRVWSPVDKPVFNLGIPGSFSPETLRILQDALGAVSTVRRVLIFVEFIDLLEPASPTGVTTPFLKTGWAEARDLADATLTRDALEASIQTITNQWSNFPSGLKPNGQMYDGIFREPTEAEGPGVVFGQKMTSNADRVVAIRAHLKKNQAADFAQLDTVRTIIKLCLERGIALDFALPPVHAELLRLLDLAGLWPRYLAMRDALSSTVADAGGGKVKLWSFMGFDEYSTERVPGLNIRTAALQWFWEPNHFRPELGELVLQTIYNGRSGIGVLLTPQLDTPDNQAQTEALERDRQAQPGEWARANIALVSAEMHSSK
jgi:hypothetical protein